MYLLIKMEYIEEHNMVLADNMTSLNISTIITDDEFFLFASCLSSFIILCVREQINVL